MAVNPDVDGPVEELPHAVDRGADGQPGGEDSEQQIVQPSEDTGAVGQAHQGQGVHPAHPGTQGGGGPGNRQQDHEDLVGLCQGNRGGEELKERVRRKLDKEIGREAAGHLQFDGDHHCGEGGDGGGHHYPHQ